MIPNISKEIDLHHCSQKKSLGRNIFIAMFLITTYEVSCPMPIRPMHLSPPRRLFEN